MSRNRLLQYLVSFFAVAQAVSGFVVGSVLDELVDNGINAVSDSYTTQIIPAGYAFVVWAPIYLGLIAFGVYQFARSRRDDPVIAPLRAPLLAAMVLNTVWVPFASLDIQWAAMLILFATTASLAVMFVRLKDNIRSLGRRDWWFIAFPTVLFFGWATVASVVSVALFLIAAGWDGLGIADAVWSALALSAATAVVLFVVSISQGNRVYGGVAMWAFIAIAVAYPGLVQVVGFSAAGLVFAVLLYLNWQVDAHQRSPRLTTS